MKTRPSGKVPSQFLNDTKRVVSKSAPSNLISANTPFHIKEALKTVRTNLIFALAPAKNKIVVFSSALPNDGKSTNCANLAITMAQTGAHVLLIDGDMRKPVQYKKFKLGNQKGLSSILCGLDSIEDSIHKNVMVNLDIITSGPIRSEERR